MITFTDAHEAELWRAVAAGQIVTLSTVQPTLSLADVAAHAGLFADAAVLEYRKRCGPGVIPESVDSFIRQAVNFADKVGSRAADDSIRGMASRLIENGEQLLAEGDE